MRKILILTNHSYMLYRFRLELIQELMKEHEVLLSMPFVGHEEDFQALGLRCIKTDVDRRGINPVTDIKLFHTYQDIVLPFSIPACGGTHPHYTTGSKHCSHMDIFAVRHYRGAATNLPYYLSGLSADNISVCTPY